MPPDLKRPGITTLGGGAALLAAITLLALALRVQNIDFDLPESYQLDEDHEVMRALALGSGQFTSDRVFKGGYFYILFAEYGAYYLGLRAAGKVKSPREFAVRFVQDRTTFYVIGRLTTALLGALSVVLLYMLGRKVAPRPVALLAALYLAVSPTHVASSHFITLDVPVTFWVLLSFLAMFRLMERPAKRQAMLAGASVAVALMHKFAVLPLVLPLVCCCLSPATRSGPGDLRLRLFSVSLLAALAVYLLGNPTIVTAGWTKLASLWGVLFRGDLVHGQQDPAKVSQFLAKSDWRWSYYLVGLAEALSVTVALLSGVGVVLASLEKKMNVKAILLFALPFFLLISVSRSFYFVRYLMPVLPFAALFGAMGLDWMLSRVPGPPALRRVALPVLGFLLSVAPARASIGNNARLDLPDTRDIARQWIEAHVPSGAGVLMDMGRFRANMAPPIQQSPEALRRMKDQAPGAGMKKYLDLQIEQARPPFYDIHSTIHGTEVRTISEHIREGISHFVIVDGVARRFLSEPGRTLFPRSFAFYSALDTTRRLELAARFQPVDGALKGPDLRIYRTVSDTTR